MDYRSPAGYDRTRNAVIGHKDFDLTYLEEAYTSEHWLVRVYRVKKPDEFNRCQGNLIIFKLTPFTPGQESRQETGRLGQRSHFQRRATRGSGG